MLGSNELPEGCPHWLVDTLWRSLVTLVSGLVSHNLWNTADALNPAAKWIKYWKQTESLGVCILASIPLPPLFPTIDLQVDILQSHTTSSSFDYGGRLTQTATGGKLRSCDQLTRRHQTKRYEYIYLTNHLFLIQGLPSLKYNNFIDRRIIYAIIITGICVTIRTFIPYGQYTRSQYWDGSLQVLSGPRPPLHSCEMSPLLVFVSSLGERRRALYCVLNEGRNVDG